MNIDFRSNDEFPYGPNIHFACDLSSWQLLYVHPSLNWAVSDENGISKQAFISKLQSEDINAIKETLDTITAGLFEGSLKLRLEVEKDIRWIQITPFLIKQQSADLIIGTVTNITDEVVNQEAIAKYTNKKNSILHMLGHDLRGPLNMANSVVKVMEQEITEPTLLKKTKYIANILFQSIGLINNLISREFIETAEIVLVKKRVDIVMKLNEYLEECKRSADIAERKFSLTSSSDKIILKLDDAKFMQVVNNLISNSLKFTKPAGQISIHVFEDDQHISFAFKDDGIGIPAEILPNIFDEYSGAGRRGLQGEPSIGLGLSIVKNIIDWHQGEIQCESKEGKGTTFHIRLPKN